VQEEAILTIVERREKPDVRGRGGNETLIQSWEGVGGRKKMGPRRGPGRLRGLSDGRVRGKRRKKKQQVGTGLSIGPGPARHGKWELQTRETSDRADPFEKKEERNEDRHL